MKVVTDPEIRLRAVGEVTSFLQTVWQLIEDGRVDTLQPDPFFQGRGELTEGIVRQVVGTIEFDVFEHEIIRYPAYHQEHQQLEPGDKLVRPGFVELPYSQQLALVQGVYRILEKYRA